MLAAVAKAPAVDVDCGARRNLITVPVPDSKFACNTVLDAPIPAVLMQTAVVIAEAKGTPVMLKVPDAFPLSTEPLAIIDTCLPIFV